MYTASPGLNGEPGGALTTVPATSGQGMNTRGPDEGGKSGGQRSSPAQGATACTRMRCSEEFGDGVGVGRVVRMRDWEWAFGCWIARMVLGGILVVVSILRY